MRILNSIFLIIFLIFPAIALSAGSIVFSYDPNIVFQNVPTGAQAVVSGQLVLQNATNDDYFLGVKIFPGTTAPTPDQQEVGSWSYVSVNPQTLVFNATTSYILNSGSPYYFVFRTVPSSPDIVGETRLIFVTTPGAPNAGNQTGDANCEGCGLDISSDEINVQGWPQEVIDNPLAVNDLNNFIIGLLNALLKIGIPVLTVFLVYSGLRLVTARGNEKELEEAKKNLFWVIIGGVILLGAWTIVKVLKGTFDQIDLAFINSLINLV